MSSHLNAAMLVAVTATQTTPADGATSPTDFRWDYVSLVADRADS
ncbi:hypothetical protein M8Z33_31990 [Streptomyces sp. ZAF1911]|nr:hypothetical protein [Streptomyces sp. ZAF1911]MDD9381192.1 hypothetical protein [Streptomyces sp. ZAF1911]